MEAHTHKKGHPSKRERGQALVEMVLVLPFLLVLVVGIVEAGVALNRQLTVVNAAREGARFGAFGASADDIHTETLLATSQMFEFTEENAVVVVINAETNEDGDSFEEWTETLYPADATVPHVTQGEVLGDLREEGGCAREPTSPCPDASDLRLVVVDVRYDHESMLGLPFVGAMADQIPIGSWTAMRLASPGTGNPGCCAYPIALDMVTVNWPNGWPKGTEMQDIRVGAGSGQFGWLYWDPDANGSATNLAENLHSGCKALDEFKNACDPADTTLNVGDWISGDSGEVAAVEGDVEALIGRHIRLPIWDQFVACNNMPPTCDCKPGTEVVHIVGFAIVEITKVHFSPGDPDVPTQPKNVYAKFIRFDDSCE